MSGPSKRRDEGELDAVFTFLEPPSPFTFGKSDPHRPPVMPDNKIRACSPVRWTFEYSFLIALWPWKLCKLKTALLPNDLRFTHLTTLTAPAASFRFPIYRPHTPTSSTRLLHVLRTRTDLVSNSVHQNGQWNAGPGKTTGPYCTPRASTTQCFPFTKDSHAEMALQRQRKKQHCLGLHLGCGTSDQ